MKKNKKQNQDFFERNFGKILIIGLITAFLSGIGIVASIIHFHDGLSWGRSLLTAFAVVIVSILGMIFGIFPRNSRIHDDLL